MKITWPLFFPDTVYIYSILYILHNEHPGYLHNFGLGIPGAHLGSAIPGHIGISIYTWTRITGVLSLPDITLAV